MVNYQRVDVITVPVFFFFFWGLYDQCCRGDRHATMAKDCNRTPQSLCWRYRRFVPRGISAQIVVGLAWQLIKVCLLGCSTLLLHVCPWSISKDPIKLPLKRWYVWDAFRSILDQFGLYGVEKFFFAASLEDGISLHPGSLVPLSAPERHPKMGSTASESPRHWVTVHQKLSCCN